MYAYKKFFYRDRFILIWHTNLSLVVDKVRTKLTNNHTYPTNDKEMEKWCNHVGKTGVKTSPYLMFTFKTLTKTIVDIKDIIEFIEGSLDFRKNINDVLR